MARKTYNKPEIQQLFSYADPNLEVTEEGDHYVFRLAGGHVRVCCPQLAESALPIFGMESGDWTHGLMLDSLPGVDEIEVITGVYSQCEGAEPEFRLCPPHAATHLLLQAVYEPLEVPSDNDNSATEFGLRLNASQIYVSPSSLNLYAWVVPIQEGAITEKCREFTACYNASIAHQDIMAELNPMVEQRVRELMANPWLPRLKSLKGVINCELTEEGCRLTLTVGSAPQVELYSYTIDGLLDLSERYAHYAEFDK